MAATLGVKLARIAIVVAVFALWEILSRTGVVNPRLLPSASDTLATLWELLQRASVRNDLAVTASEVLIAFVLAVPCGALIGFLIAENRYFAEVAKPLLFFAFSIPKSIFLPMFILVFGVGFSQKVGFGFFSTIFIVIMSTTTAVESVKLDHLTVARSYGATPLQTAFRVYLPSMLPVLGSAADFHDLQPHRRDSGGNVCLARRHRPSDRDLGRELPDEAAARRRGDDRGDCHDIQRTGPIGRNTMQPLANITPLKPPPRAGAIKVSNVSQVFKTSTQDVVALSDISLEVKPGRFVVLVGPSGCGKSTLLMMMAGLRQQTSGTILINDAPILQPDPNRVGVVFQEASLFPWLTAEENVEFPLALRGVAKAERRAKAEDALKLVGLEGFGKRHPHELSGGMKQRVSIARGLVQDPPVLLMDEPFAALDEQTRMTMGDELLRIWAATGKTVVFVTHSLTEAVYLADEVIVMSARPGRIVDQLTIPLPRPRTYEMLSGDTFGTLRDRIWRHIRKSA
jgi:NitT/TauT family transport system ATP-binding protein